MALHLECCDEILCCPILYTLDMNPSLSGIYILCMLLCAGYGSDWTGIMVLLFKWYTVTRRCQTAVTTHVITQPLCPLTLVLREVYTGRVPIALNIKLL